MGSIDKINFAEAELFYKSPHALVDYSLMQSFSLIRSCIEVFAYYGCVYISPDDIKEFFERIKIVKKGQSTPFIPSLKKAEGVLDCCLEGANRLSKQGDRYHIDFWDTTGYKYEITHLQWPGARAVNSRT